MTDPIAEPRRVEPQKRLMSSRVGIMPLKETALGSIWVESTLPTLSIISVTPKMDMAMMARPMPSDSSGMPKA